MYLHSRIINDNADSLKSAEKTIAELMQEKEDLESSVKKMFPAEFENIRKTARISAEQEAAKYLNPEKQEDAYKRLYALLYIQALKFESTLIKSEQSISNW